MGFNKKFSEFIIKGNAMDLAVGVIMVLLWKNC